MLKIQKLSLAALMVSAVVSGSVFAEDKAAPSASDASYAVGALMGNQVKDLSLIHIYRFSTSRLSALRSSPCT